MYFDLLDSTNNYIKRNIEKLDHLDVISALSQSSGRGRENRTWMSNGENLYFSLLLKEKILHNSLFKYIMVSSLALVKTLKYFNIESTIKYPNDILVHNKKIAGILIESSGFINIDFLIIGIGLNINQIDFKELNDKATAMKIVKGNNFNLKEVLKIYLNNFDIFYRKDQEVLLKQYKENSYVIGRVIADDGKKYKVIDISLDGLISLEYKGNIIKKSFNEINFKDIY